MLCQMMVELLRAVWAIDRAKNKESVVVFDYMVGNRPFSSLQTLVGVVLEAKLGGVIGSSLLGITNPES